MVVPIPTNITSLTPQQKSRIAFMRFGLGPKPGGPARIGMGATSAQLACLRELENPAAALIDPTGMVTYQEACDAAHDKVNSGELSHHIAVDELNARYAKHLEPEVGFLERLVLFWSNHFSMHMEKNALVRVSIGNMERTVIRKNVLGKFADLLKGVIQHPGMISYLDNDRSVGPLSARGGGDDKYNENLAREILELYTVGASAGYTQADVTQFAYILTGWQFNTANYGDSSKWGQFFFDPGSHQPGTFTVMGQSFAPTGKAQGLALLDYLAGHPATAQHISRKLLLHFVTDEPSQEQINQLAAVFMSTGGDLKQLAQTLLQMPSAWTTEMKRIRPPHLWLVSITRAMNYTKANVEANGRAYVGALAYVDNSPWTYVTPDGFPDEDYAWMNPDAMRVRTGLADAVMRKSGDRRPRPNAVTLAQDLFPEHCQLRPGTPSRVLPSRQSTPIIRL